MLWYSKIFSYIDTTVFYDLFHNGNSKTLPAKHWQRAIDLLDIMEAIDLFEDLVTKGFPPSLRLHKLKGNRCKEFAIDIHKTDGWRMTFKFSNNQFLDVKIENYH